MDYNNNNNNNNNNDNNNNNNNNTNIFWNLVRNSNDVIVNMENMNVTFQAKPKAGQDIFCPLKIPSDIQSKMIVLLSKLFHQKISHFTEKGTFH